MAHGWLSKTSGVGEREGRMGGKKEGREGQREEERKKGEKKKDRRLPIIEVFLLFIGTALIMLRALVFLVVLFTTIKIWNQPECPPTNE